MALPLPGQAPREPGHLAVKRRASKKPRQSDCEPYASIPASLIGSRAYRGLSDAAVRLLWLMEAAYTPAHEWFVPVNQAVADLHVSATTVCAARAELVAAGIIVPDKPGTPPRTMGANRIKAGGRAATFRLPHREEAAREAGKPAGGAPARGRFLWFQEGDRAWEGYWRVGNGHLRGIVLDLCKHDTAKVLSYFHATDRTHDGAPADNPPRCPSPEEVGIPKRTLQRGLADLVKRGRLALVEAGTGQRRATYRLADKEAGGRKELRSRRKAG